MAVFMFGHKHRFGGDAKLVRVPDNIDLQTAFYNADEEGQAEIGRAFGIDFEPELDEELNVEFVNLDDIFEVDAAELPKILTDFIA